MVRSRQGVQQQKWLAVLDGRFLPVDEMTISIERDAQDVFQAGSLQPAATVTTAEILSGTIETRREPALKPNPKQLRLYGPDESYLIWSLCADTAIGIDFGEGYKVEFEATDWSCIKR